MLGPARPRGHRSTPQPRVGATRTRQRQRLGSFNPVAGDVVTRVRGIAAALEQPITRPVLPARGTGEYLAVLQHGFTDDLLARVVALIAVTITGLPAEVVARDHD